jgi:ligand-binding sensor domain-containing protein/AraC-like DNA-binding protein
VIDDLPGARVTAVAGNERSTLWIGTSRGLAAIRNGRQTVFRTRDGLAGDFVYCLFTDSRGSLWVGTTSGLSRIDAEGIRSFSTADGLADDLVRAIAEDAQGRLWIGTDKGVTILDPGKQVFCAIPEGLAGDAVMTICRDREGGMWVGTASGGLNYSRRNEVRVYGTGDGLSGQQISSICEDPEGRLWVGTRDRGLNWLKSGTWHSYSRRDGLDSDFITSLMPDHQGRLWIGTIDAGLQFMDQGSFRPARPQDGLSGGTILSLFIDRKDGLWVGSDGNGLDHCLNGNWRHYGPAGGLDAEVITAIGEDRQGKLWVGSARNGLHVLDNGKWRRFSTSDGLAGDTVYAIHVDEKSGVWLGTDGGLGLYSHGRFYSFRQGAALLNGTVLAILEDAGGRLWMSSPAGIFSVRRSELEDAAAYGGANVHCRHFTEMSGLKSTVCTGGFQPAGCRDGHGRLWFPTQKGLVAIDPAQLGSPPPPPVPRVERLQADGLTVSLAGRHRFPAGTERFDFQYAATGFSDPQQIEFSTRLEGFDDGWSDPGRAHDRHFTALSSGSYFFQVRARGQGGLWSEGAAGFRFAVTPYFHRTAWFYLSLLALTGSTAAGLLFYRRRKARRRREDRYKSSLLSDEMTVEYIVRLEQGMKLGKLYLDPDLTLAKLAESAAIPAKHLSQIINERYELNFNDFINRQRVEEAKRKLVDPAAREFKLLRIAFESGFNSKSVFNSAFRKNTGLSPSEFRKLLGDGAANGDS